MKGHGQLGFFVLIYNQCFIRLNISSKYTGFGLNSHRKKIQIFPYEYIRNDLVVK